MDSYETTRALFTRIQSIDPDNASKIMGYILIQDQPDSEILHLAFGPDSHLLNLISRAKSHLGISSNTLSTGISSNTSSALASSSSPQPVSPASSLSNPISISRPSPLSLPSPRFNTSSPSSLWAATASPNPNSLSYAAVVNGTSSPAAAPKLDGFIGEEYTHFQDQNHPFFGVETGPKALDFVDGSHELAMSPGCRSDPLGYPSYWEGGGTSSEANSPHYLHHRRSCSDVCYGSDDSTSFGLFKPCLYYQRGFCKNGTNCKFVHGFGESGESSPVGSGSAVGSPASSCNKFDAAFENEMLRSKVAQQQRIAAAQFMAGVNFPYNKLNFLQTEAQRSAAAALMMGEEFHKMNRCKVGRNEFSPMGGGDVNPGSRQIYLTFPADSTFREEDVSNYFSMYGPVQDVRIPYQQKRMFGFVTFVYPETVKLILAKGNPHFVCDSRVLVKPYKEKGKLPDKKQQQQQQMERGEFPSCLSPSGLDCREPFDIQLGSRVIYNTQEMLWRRKLEQQADIQQALELHGRRLMNLKLMDLKSHYQPLNNISVGSPLASPHRGSFHLSNGFAHDIPQESKGSTAAAATPDGQLAEEVNAIDGNGNGKADGGSSGKEDEDSNNDECDFSESLEHILPDNLFSSPTKSLGEHRSIFSPSAAEIDGSHIMTSALNPNGESLMPAASSLGKAPLKSCFLEIPRFSSGHGAIGM